jgi:hypothetical protein
VLRLEARASSAGVLTEMVAGVSAASVLASMAVLRDEGSGYGEVVLVAAVTTLALVALYLAASRWGRARETVRLYKEQGS